MLEYVAPDVILIVGLCMARFVFNVAPKKTIEFYCPAWLAKWYDDGVSDLTGCGTILGVEDAHDDPHQLHCPANSL